MSKKRVYAAIEIADQEIRLIVLEIFEARYNVLRTERVACSGVDKNQKIVDESAIVTAIRQAITNAQAALGYRIERVLLAVPSVNVMRSSQKVRVQIEDGTKNIRLFHIQQGFKNAIQKRLNEDVEFVNANKVTYEVNGTVSQKLPLYAAHHHGISVRRHGVRCRFIICRQGNNLFVCSLCGTGKS